MQARFNNLDIATLDRTKMTGFEYEILMHDEPSFFVITKLQRTYKKLELCCIYYIVQGVIYQAPNLSILVSNRLLSAVHHLQRALSISQENSKFNTFKGYSWKDDKEPEISKSALCKSALEQKCQSEFLFGINSLLDSL